MTLRRLPTMVCLPAALGIGAALPPPAEGLTAADSQRLPLEVCQ